MYVIVNITIDSLMYAGSVFLFLPKKNVANVLLSPFFFMDNKCY